MENASNKAGDLVEEASNKVQEGASHLPEIIKRIVDNFTGKDIEVTYSFRNLVVDIPRVTGPEGKEIASAKWKINGRFIMSTQLLETSDSTE